MSQRKHIAHFFILYFFYIGAGAVFWPFASFYFIENGITPSELGATMSAGTFVAILGFNVLGYACDKLKRLDIMVLILFLFACILTLIMQSTSVLSLVIIVYIVYAFVSSPTESIIDTWAIECYKNDSMRRHFGLIRSGGSLSFAVIVVSAGFIIGNGNHFDRLPLLIYITSLLGIAYIIYLMRNRNLKNFYSSKTDKQKASVWQDTKKLFGVRDFSALVIKCMLVRIPMSMIGVFSPYVFQSVGGGVWEHALFLNISALLEIPFFVLNTRLLAKLNTNILIIVPLFASITKTLIFIFAPSANMLLLGSVFSTIEFTMLYPALRYEVSKTAPNELRTTAHSIISIVYFSVPTIISGYLGGLLVEKIGVNYAFVAALIVLVVMSLFLIITTFIKFKAQQVKLN